jgi:hypothetical protein
MMTLATIAWEVLFVVYSTAALTVIAVERAELFQPAVLVLVGLRVAFDLARRFGSRPVESHLRPSGPFCLIEQ